MVPDEIKNGGPYDISAVEFLEEIIDYRVSPDKKGKPVGGIPYTKPNYKFRSLSVMNISDGAVSTAWVGKDGYDFSQQSMSKPGAACYLMSLLGPGHLGLVEFKKELGNKFSGPTAKYNEANLLAPGVPNNYSDNIGALKVWQMIARATAPSLDPFDGYYRWFVRLTNSTDTTVNLRMAKGEYNESSSKNHELLMDLNIIPGSAEWYRTYYSYCRACAIMVTTENMANVYGVIANKGKHPKTQEQMIPPMIADHVHNGLADHGAYNESQKIYRKSGVHSKTGVDGGVMGQIEKHPSWVYCGNHCGLNGDGNSGEVQKWADDLAQLQLVWSGGDGLAAMHLPPRQPTGEALDLLLRSRMKLTTKAALETGLNDFIRDNTDELSKPVKDRKEGYYLKLNPKNKPLPSDARKLTEGTDTEGVLKEYYAVPDSHNLHKIVVERSDLSWNQNLARKTKKAFSR